MKSVKLKLMLLCSFLSITIIVVILLFTVKLIDPLYSLYFQNEMHSKLDEIVEVFEATDIRDWLKNPEETAETVKDLLVNGNCLDVAHISIPSLLGRTTNSLAFFEGIGNCELHTLYSFSTADTQDSEVAALYRAKILDDGSVNGLSLKGGQWVIGTVTENGFILTFSSSVSQVDKVTDFFVKCIYWLAAILIPFSLVISYIFANWFTQPIRRLQKATHLMANGKYDIEIPVTTKDEIGILTQEFNHMAYQVNKSDLLQKDLVSNISHDLRTPLTLVKGYAETIRDLTGDSKEKRDVQLGIIINETDRLSNLVNSVLTLGKITSGVQKPETVIFDIQDFCEELLEKYTDACAKNGATINFIRDENIQDVCADPQLIGRVLHNLISNGLAHIGEDKVLVLRISKVKTGACIEIIDKGEGIDPDECTHVFDRYYRSRKNTGRTGTGLGLSIVKAILQQHGFAFGVKSIVGVGSNFWFIISESKPITIESKTDIKRILYKK